MHQLIAIQTMLNARGVTLPPPPRPSGRARVSQNAQARGALKPLAWAARHRRIDDRPFSLKDFAPLAEIYDDDHPCIAIIKPAQVGVSEMAVTRTLHALDVGAYYWQTGKAGLNVGYLFPTQTALYDFSKERFSNATGESPHLAGLFSSRFDDVGFKQAGQSFLYLRGAWSAKALKSFPADMLIFDEYDEMSPVAVALAEKRLRQSVVKRRLYISTPTLPGLGIHALYLTSDQRVWEVLCSSCQTWSELNFWRDVRADGDNWDAWQRWDEETLLHARLTTHCPSCASEIDRCGPGRWTAQRPEITAVRGYQIPSLCFPVVKLHDLARNAIKVEPEQIQEFYRSDLGLPYEPKGSRITETMLNQLSHRLPGGQLPANVNFYNATMGVDVGRVLHYRVSATGSDGQLYVLEVGGVDEWSELDTLMAKHKIRQCVIDALPELHKCQEWAAKFPGRVLRAFYPKSGELRGQLCVDSRKDGIIHINRTMGMDKVYAAIAGATANWPAAAHRDAELRAHLKAPVRVVSRSDDGDERVDWVHTAPDHLFHASVYDLVAREVLPAHGTPNFFGSSKRSTWR